MFLSPFPVNPMYDRCDRKRIKILSLSLSYLFLYSLVLSLIPFISFAISLTLVSPPIHHHPPFSPYPFLSFPPPPLHPISLFNTSNSEPSSFLLSFSNKKPASKLQLKKTKPVTESKILPSLSKSHERREEVIHVQVVLFLSLPLLPQ